MFKKHDIGETLFAHVKNLEKMLGFSRLCVKFEAGKPHGNNEG